jgi:hypothetical protein
LPGIALEVGAFEVLGPPVLDDEEAVLGVDVVPPVGTADTVVYEATNVWPLITVVTV